MGENQVVKISLRGESPKPWGTNEWRWRQAVSTAAREQAHQFEGPKSAVHRYFEVDITFYLRQPSFGQSDLDNLAKPVLDTLFHAKHPQAKTIGVTGALLPDVDDDRVVSLNLKKMLVSDEHEVGADIVVRAARSPMLEPTDDEGPD